MKLSVIVPAYNVEEELKRCISSLLRQEEAELEILLVDDGSTDPGCGALCDRYAAEYPDRIRAFHRPNGGPGAARNTGIDAAAGEYLLFVDGDDYVSGQFLSTLLPYTEKGFDVVGFDFRIDDHGMIAKQPDEILPYGKTVSLPDLPGMILSSPCVWNKMWRRALFAENGIRFPEGIWYEDLATVPKLYAAAEKMTAIRKPLYYYVVREGSVTRNTEIGRNREIMTAMDSLLGWFRANGSERAFYPELEAAAVKHVLLTASVRALRAGYDPELLDDLSGYLRRTFPAWKDNTYVKKFPARHRWILRQLTCRRYRLVRTLFLLKDSMRGRNEEACKKDGETGNRG